MNRRALFSWEEYFREVLCLSTTRFIIEKTMEGVYDNIGYDKDTM